MPSIESVIYLIWIKIEFNSVYSVRYIYVYTFTVSLAHV